MEGRKAIGPARGAGRAVFRADAGPGIGGGHLTRCLALAGALTEAGWRCAMALRPPGLKIMPWMARTGIEVFELQVSAEREPEALCRRWPEGCDLLVVDHYRRDAHFETDCRGWARRVLCIDDLADRPHACDLLLDPTVDRNPGEYDGRVPAECVTLTGAPYALLRPQFALKREASLARRCESRSVNRVLVSFGMLDGRRLCLTALNALDQSGFSGRIDVVIGAAAPHIEKLQRVAQDSGGRVWIHENCRQPASLMVKADLALGAGGGSSLERCCLGLPTIVRLAAGNQDRMTHALAQRGAIELLSDGDEAPVAMAKALERLFGDVRRRREMSSAAASICDGRGALRLLLALAGNRRSRSGSQIRLRPAETRDARKIFAWQTKPGMRDHFRQTRPPEWEEHRNWFADKLQQPGAVMLLVLADDVPAGLLRLDSADGMDRIKEVSILIAPSHQRQGLAAAALDLVAEAFPGAGLAAEVMPGNKRSHHLFAAAGYQRQNDGWYLLKPRWQ